MRFCSYGIESKDSISNTVDFIFYFNFSIIFFLVLPKMKTFPPSKVRVLVSSNVIVSNIGFPWLTGLGCVLEYYY